MCIRDQTYYPDVLVDAVRLVVEIDGLHHARDDQTYQSDLWRMNDFATAGYAMLRYTLADLEQRPSMILRDIRTMVRRLEREGRTRR